MNELKYTKIKIPILFGILLVLSLREIIAHNYFLINEKLQFS